MTDESSDGEPDNVRRTLFVVDRAREYSQFGFIFNRLQQGRIFLEMNLWVLPRIRKLGAKPGVAFLWCDDALGAELSRSTAAALVRKPSLDEGLDYALAQSYRLAREWHVYGELSDLLRFRGVDIADVLEETLMGEFLSLFVHMDVASGIVRQAVPRTLYVQSELFPEGRAFSIIADVNAVQCRFLLPSLYRSFVGRGGAYLRRKMSSVPSFQVFLASRAAHDAPEWKVLFDVPSPNYLNAMLPVIQYLSRFNSCECYFIGRQSDFAGRIAHLRRIRPARSSATERWRRANQVREYYHSQLADDAQFQERFLYRDINFWSATRERIGRLFNVEFRGVIADLATFCKAIDVVRPDILVVGSDSASAMRGHALLAKRSGIPILEVQHGLRSPRECRAAPLADRIAVGGEYSKRVYAKYGVLESQIVVTGWPKFDIYCKPERCSAIQAWATTKNILFATQPSLVSASAVIETIGRFIQDAPGLHLSVKPHPAENAAVYRRRASHYARISVRRSRDDVGQLIASSDVVIVQSSTVGIEAALQDKPLICLNLADSLDEVQPYVSSGVAIEVRELADLVPVIKAALYDEEVRARLAEARKKFVYEHAYIQDGQASKRVADLILRMIEESRKARSET